MKKLSIIPIAMLAACGGKNDPETVGARPIQVEKLADYDGTGLIGYQPVTMRARIGAKGEEVVGAYCEMTGSGFKAKFLTPAIIMVPNFGTRNQNLATYCRFEEHTATQIQTSRKKTGLDLASVAEGVGGIAGGAVGGLVAGTVTGLVTKKPTSDYGYENTTVIFSD